jgi:hypothetical protein
VKCRQSWRNIDCSFIVEKTLTALSLLKKHWLLFHCWRNIDSSFIVEETLTALSLLKKHWLLFHCWRNIDSSFIVEETFIALSVFKKHWLLFHCYMLMWFVLVSAFQSSQDLLWCSLLYFVVSSSSSSSSCSCHGVGPCVNPFRSHIRQSLELSSLVSFDFWGQLFICLGDLLHGSRLWVCL